MLRRFLAISGFALLGLAISGTASYAADATQDITFTSDVAATCFFGSVTGTSTLSLQANSVSNLGNATQSVPLTCNNAATLSAGTVAQSGTGATTLNTKTVGLTVNGSAFTSGGTIAATTFDADSNGAATIGVTLSASHTAPIKPGNYTFTTTLTATPQ